MQPSLAERASDELTGGAHLPARGHGVLLKDRTTRSLGKTAARQRHVAYASEAVEARGEHRSCNVRWQRATGLWRIFVDGRVHPPFGE